MRGRLEHSLQRCQQRLYIALDVKEINIAV
jgi:hypothetical protein